MTEKLEVRLLTMPITHRQGQFLAFILRYTERYGRSPSFDEMAAHFGITSPSVNGMIKTLERKALISRIPGGARTLRVEVPAHLLPSIDFDRDKSRKSTKPQREASAPALAALTAIAVLDTVMPMLLNHGVCQEEVNNAVLKSAQRIGESLTRAGVSTEHVLAVRRQVASEISRWQSNGRGLTVSGPTWQRPRR
jgi:SOS-response transcriptional repressor LexA